MDFTIAPAVKKGNVDLQEWVNQELDRLEKKDTLKKPTKRLY